MNEEQFDELLRIQRLVTDRLSIEERMDRKIKLMGLIGDMVSGPDNSVQTETLRFEASNEGFTDDETTRLIHELRGDGMIVEQNGNIMII